MIGSHEGDNIHNEAPSSEGNDADNVDVAIADALKAQKNRQTGKLHIGRVDCKYVL